MSALFSQPKVCGVQREICADYNLFALFAGHLFPITSKLRAKVADIYADDLLSVRDASSPTKFEAMSRFNESCERPSAYARFGSPIAAPYIAQYFNAVHD